MRLSVRHPAFRYAVFTLVVTRAPVLWQVILVSKKTRDILTTLEPVRRDPSGDEDMEHECEEEEAEAAFSSEAAAAAAKSKAAATASKGRKGKPAERGRLPLCCWYN